MRSIRFRAWDKVNKEMLFPDCIQWEIGLKTGIEPPWIGFPTKNGGYGTAPLDTVELMQFTGLTDRKGKEVWEGDVVRHANFSSAVFWDGEFGAWAISVESTGGNVSEDLLSNHLDVNEVICNLYENPESVTP